MAKAMHYATGLATMKANVMNQYKDSRELAFLIIKRVLDEGITLEQAIDTFSNDMAPVDRGFIRNLVATTIRRLGQLDRIIDHSTQKKLGNTQMATRHVLRLGICQLLFANVPSHAAVNTSVNIVERHVTKKLQYLKKMVNAVLRKIDRDRDSLLKKFGNSRLNIPKWILERWDTRYGPNEVKEIISQILVEAPLDIAIKPDQDIKYWARQMQASLLPMGGLRLEKAGNIKELPAFQKGIWWVQDIAAQLPVHLLSASKGDEVLDLCAAPGGKALQSAAKGSNVTAVDISLKRLERLKENMKRLSLDVKVIHSDVLTYEPKSRWDYILLDAPCTSTGTIRRHPEILRSPRQAMIEEMSRIQRDMLDKAAELLNPGGTLVYCVCSMESEEGPDQIKALLKRHGTLKRKEIKAKELPGLERAILNTGDVQTLPHYYKGGMDGFFISRLTKKEGN